MDCAQFNSVLDRSLSQPGLRADALRHLSECTRCRELYAWFSQGQSAEISAAVRNRITASLAASLRPVTPLPALPVTVSRLVVVFAVLWTMIVAVMGTAGILRMDGLQLVATTVLLLSGAVLCSLALSAEMRPGARRYSWPAAVLVPIALAALGLLFPWDSVGSFVAQGWPCLVGSLTVAALGVLLLGLVVRRGTAVAPRMAGLTLGAAGGWLGLAVFQDHCPHQQAPHLLVWHGGALLLSIAGGWALASLVRRPSEKFSARP